jgi:hypothetical protein
MKQAISRWPAVYVRVPPELFARIEAENESRTLPASVIVREALARAFSQEPARGVLSPPKLRDGRGGRTRPRGPRALGPLRARVT